MLNRDAERIDRVIRESLRKTNNRGVILSGWSELQNTSTSEILYLDAVHHPWLLPRCKAIIHHGGAGTTSAGLHAGIPNIVIPFMADQPFWGNRVHALGVGPKPIPVRKLSIENLTKAIVESETHIIREQAQFFGQELRRENGVANSIERIENYSYGFPGMEP
jgi:sterol 3beta-glucosyltransferase